jgi:hypothetical protein
MGRWVRIWALGGIAAAVLLVGMGGNAIAAHAIPAKTYSGKVPKTNLTVLIKTDKHKSGPRTARAALECSGTLVRLNPTFQFERALSFFPTDIFTSAPGNTGNGTFDIRGRVKSPFKIKAKVMVNTIPGCFNNKDQNVTLELAGRKVSENLAAQIANGVHMPATIATSCPPNSGYENTVHMTARLSPDTGGSLIRIETSNTRGVSTTAKTLTAADGSFSFSFVQTPSSGPAYKQRVTMTFAGGAGRDPTSNSCTWQVG